MIGNVYLTFEVPQGFPVKVPWVYVCIFIPLSQISLLNVPQGLQFKGIYLFRCCKLSQDSVAFKKKKKKKVNVEGGKFINCWAVIFRPGRLLTANLMEEKKWEKYIYRPVARYIYPTLSGHHRARHSYLTVWDLSMLPLHGSQWIGILTSCFQIHSRCLNWQE